MPRPLLDVARVMTAFSVVMALLNLSVGCWDGVAWAAFGMASGLLVLWLYRDSPETP